MYKFDPMSTEERALNGLLPEEDYNFIIEEAHEKTSKNLNPMLMLKLNVFDRNGKKRTITDYVTHMMPLKFLHLFQTIALMDKYNAGEFETRDLLGKRGICKIKIKEHEGEKRNYVSDYFFEESEAQLDSFEDKDLPW